MESTCEKYNLFFPSHTCYVLRNIKEVLGHLDKNSQWFIFRECDGNVPRKQGKT